MTRMIAEQSISLDGFSAGANDGPTNPMGDHGQRLHEWLFADGDGPDASVPVEYWTRPGAVMFGKRMFDNCLESWDGDNPRGVPAFVLTHVSRVPLTKNGDIKFTFVGDGIEGALARARGVAGGKDVATAGGASVIRQFLGSGLLDEMHVHVVPMFLGGGVRLFDEPDSYWIGLESVQAFGSSAVTHLLYRIVR